MAWFWKRDEDRAVEQLLRANRPEPRDEFASSILGRITDAPIVRRAATPRRFGAALALTVVALGLAAVLGGISAASAGMGGIVHVATKAVSPSHGRAAGANTSSSRNDNSAKDDEGDQDGDHHQYQVGVCHWANHKYVLIFVSPQGAANHLKNHPNDKLPVNGHC